MATQLSENALNDIKKNILSGNKEINQDNFWPIYSALIKTYNKNKMRSELGDKLSSYNMDQFEKASENQEKILAKVMFTMPKYSLFFKDENSEKNKIEFLKLCPKELVVDGKNSEEILTKTLTKTIDFIAENHKFIKKKSSNIDKNIYTEAIDIYEENKGLLTPELLKMAEERNGVSGVEMLYKGLQKMAEESIKAEQKYYNQLIDYTCSFYADIESAKMYEEERE